MRDKIPDWALEIGMVFAILMVGAGLLIMGWGLS